MLNSPPIYARHEGCMRGLSDRVTISNEVDASTCPVPVSCAVKKWPLSYLNEAIGLGLIRPQLSRSRCAEPENFERA
jgi:hypothetical protein